MLSRPIRLHTAFNANEYPAGDIFGREQPGKPIALFTMQALHTYGKLHYHAVETRGERRLAEEL